MYEIKMRFEDREDLKKLASIICGAIGGMCDERCPFKDHTPCPVCHFYRYDIGEFDPNWITLLPKDIIVEVKLS